VPQAGKPPPVQAASSPVARADGSSGWFVVERTAQYDKQRFPTDDVYDPTLTLRCGW
jgi:hypothetical protein